MTVELTRERGMKVGGGGTKKHRSGRRDIYRINRLTDGSASV